MLRDFEFELSRLFSRDYFYARWQWSGDGGRRKIYVHCLNFGLFTVTWTTDRA